MLAEKIGNPCGADVWPHGDKVARHNRIASHLPKGMTGRHLLGCGNQARQILDAKIGRLAIVGKYARQFLRLEPQALLSRLVGGGVWTDRLWLPERIDPAVQLVLEHSQGHKHDSAQKNRDQDKNQAQRVQHCRVQRRRQRHCAPGGCSERVRNIAPSDRQADAPMARAGSRVS